VLVTAVNAAAVDQALWAVPGLGQYWHPHLPHVEPVVHTPAGDHLANRVGQSHDPPRVARDAGHALGRQKQQIKKRRIEIRLVPYRA